jgi:hypothetical protein
MSHATESEYSAGDRPQAEDVAHDIHAKMPPAIERALEGFRRDLPELLKNKRNDRKWVAYNSRGERIGIHTSERKLHERCLRQGNQEGEFVVRCIFPELEDIDFEELMDI